MWRQSATRHKDSQSNHGMWANWSHFHVWGPSTSDACGGRSNAPNDFPPWQDHQMKIRGVRIKLPEVESRLTSIGGAQEAVVLELEDAPRGKRLVAYYVGSEDL